MAYNRDKIYKQALEAAEANNLFWIEDIVAWLPCDKTTFYRFFPTESNEYNNIKEILDQNKVKTKSEIRKKLFKSDKASELLALYRLIATEEEHKRLNQSYIDHTSKGDRVNNLDPFKQIRENAEIDEEAEKSD